jgi:hypothetical protein
MTTTKIVCLAFLESSAFAQLTSAIGTLQGFVTDSQGRPLAGTEVTYQQLVPATNARASHVPSGPVAQGQVTTDADGEFSAAGLPSGNYVLCAEVASAPYLDPCIWQQPIQVTVPAGGTSSQAVILTKGVFLKVTVNDPMGLLPQTVDGLWTPRKLLVGVQYARGAYQGAQNTAVDTGGHDYQLVIPTGVPFWLRLFSRDVALNDAAGNTVDTSGSQIAFQAAAGQDRAFTFTVSGPATQ